jgi:hypothetical protein
MAKRWSKHPSRFESCTRQFSVIAVCCAAIVFLFNLAMAQTAATGALKGTITDPSGSVVPGVQITVTSHATGETRTAITQGNGSYQVSLLSPGDYSVDASAKGFKSISINTVTIHVTEIATLDLRLQVGTITEKVTVQDIAELIQTNSSTLGSVTDQRMVENLPLVTRNYTQILGLSPGVSGEVNNSASIGRGDSSQAAATGGYSVGGSNTNDNNFQMNGSEVNDLIGEGNYSGGIPVPNPDSLQEFKVQVGQYDASYGRNAGANVDVVTKSGTNRFHGDVWEYFRNTALNANDYFLNQQDLPRGVLNQNQFGFTLGGPVLKDKLLFFVSYQGTRERDGLASGTGGCETTGFFPAASLLPNNAGGRTAAALAAAFNGQSGLFGTINSASDISPTALAVLNAQFSGNLAVPAAQNATTGASTFSSPCHYTEDQFVSDVDFNHSERSHFSGKFFFMDSTQVAPFPENQLGLPAASLTGFPQSNPNTTRDFSLTHTYSFNAHLINQAVIGFHRLTGGITQNYPNATYANSAGCGTGAFTLSSICVPSVPSFDNAVPDVIVSGPLSVQNINQSIGFNLGGNGQGVGIAQNFYDVSDSVTYVRGQHSLHVGGGINRSQINFPLFHFFGGLYYPTFVDFLLGVPEISIDVPGVFGREWRVWDGNAFVQDDYQVAHGLTLNLGFRYERQGQLGDNLGRASTFDPALANPNPPAAGTLQGFIVGSNYSGPPLPAGVIRASTNTAINNDGQNGYEPRVGFAWQIPGIGRSVLRGGYGIFFTRTTGEPFIQLLGAPPWGEIRQFLFPSPAAPFPAAPTFPIFTPYTPPTATAPFGSDLTPTVFSRSFRAPVLQRYSLNVQTALGNNWMFELGYQGARGTRLIDNRSFNQALPASAANPIRGQTTNDYSNIGERVPIEGFDPTHSLFIESEGASWYNALGASLSKRLSRGLQFLASYTWLSALETNPGYTVGSFAGGSLIGDNNNPRANYGFDGFVRPQRLVVSYVYEFPSPASHTSLAGRTLGGWSVAGVTTFQSGQKLTLVDTNNLSAFEPGETDRVQLAPNCNNNNVATSGNVTSRLQNYVNLSCFTLPPFVGNDGLATGFGNSGNGTINGPDQRNFDISIIKKIPITESKSVEFRAEFFNAFNTPSFAAGPLTLNVGTATVNPSTGAPIFAPNPTGAALTSTSIAPRVLQFALKLYF